MQKDSDEGVGSSSPTRADTPRGIHENPHEVAALETPIWTVEAPGWSSPPAFAGTIVLAKYTRPLGNGVLCWDEVRIEELHLASHSALMILQGFAPPDLFPPDAVITCGEEKILGPFIYLRGEFAPYSPKVLKVVLACPRSIPDGVTREEVLGLLVEQVMGRP